jgi:hypothetical protein
VAECHVERSEIQFHKPVKRTQKWPGCKKLCKVYRFITNAEAAGRDKNSGSPLFSVEWSFRAGLSPSLNESFWRSVDGLRAFNNGFRAEDHDLHT